MCDATLYCNLSACTLSAWLDHQISKFLSVHCPGNGYCRGVTALTLAWARLELLLGLVTLCAVSCSSNEFLSSLTCPSSPSRNGSYSLRFLSILLFSIVFNDNVYNNICRHTSFSPLLLLYRNAEDDVLLQLDDDLNSFVVIYCATLG